MPHIVADRIKESTTTTGTGNVTLAGAISGFKTFASRCANNDTFFYAIVHQGADEWEVGLGTFVSATPAVARTSVISSSNSDAAVNFSAGTKHVWIDSPAIAQGWGVLTVTPSADQNDYSPTGLAFCNVLRVNGSASLKLTGLAGGYDGRRVTIVNQATDYLLWLENQNTASSAANRFKLPQGFPAFLMPGDTITVQYNGTDSRWQVVEWPNKGQAMGLEMFADFLSSPGGIWGITQSGTGASSQDSTYLNNTTERPMGIGQIDTGTVNNGRVTLGSSGVGGIIPTLGAALSVARLAIETTVSGTETFVVISGFADSAGGAWNDGVGWENRWNGSAAEWSQTRMSGAAATRSVVNSPTPDNNYIWLVVFVNPGWTRADFIYSTDSISFVKADSPTTGLPGSGAPTVWVAASMIKSAGTTQRNCSIDLAGKRIDYVRG